MGGKDEGRGEPLAYRSHGGDKPEWAIHARIRRREKERKSSMAGRKKMRCDEPAHRVYGSIKRLAKNRKQRRRERRTRESEVRTGEAKSEPRTRHLWGKKTRGPQKKSHLASYWAVSGPEKKRIIIYRYTELVLKGSDWFHLIDFSSWRSCTPYI